MTDQNAGTARSALARKRGIILVMPTAAAVPAITCALGWSVYVDPVDKRVHLARQVSVVMKCAYGSTAVLLTKIRFDPSEEARRARLEEIQSGQAVVDCRSNGRDGQRP